MVSLSSISLFFSSSGGIGQFRFIRVSTEFSLGSLTFIGFHSVYVTSIEFSLVFLLGLNGFGEVFVGSTGLRWCQ